MGKILVLFDYYTLVHEQHRMSGSIGLLRFLKKQNFTIGVFANDCDEAEKILRDVKLFEFVTHTVSSDVFADISQKKNPLLEAETTLAVSKNPEVIKSAMTFKIVAIAVGERSTFQSADYHIKNLMEGWNLVKKYLKK